MPLVQSLLRHPGEEDIDGVDTETFEKDCLWIAEKLLHQRNGSLRYRILCLRRACVILEIERDRLGLRPRFSPQDPLVHRGGPR